jgi:hypothetical protein
VQPAFSIKHGSGPCFFLAASGEPGTGFHGHALGKPISGFRFG